MLDYVSKVVLTEHAKFRLFAPLRKRFKKRKRKKNKTVKRWEIQKNTFIVCESTINTFFYAYILDLC